jgi:hypothetical protein
MNEAPSWLHNMSAPPKSVVKYTGLAGLSTPVGTDGGRVGNLKNTGATQLGQVVRFCLPQALHGTTAQEVLSHLQIEHEPSCHGTPVQHLVALISQRALELPLPEGCAVVPSAATHPSPWPDVLAALAVLSQSTDTVWLRGKTPTLTNAMTRGAVSLLIPLAFVSQIRESKR